MPSQESFCIEVSGDFACFTRPEMKVERVSYDVITPSAGRAIFDAILWKPAISWQIQEIEVLKPISWINIRRNEIASVFNNSKQQIFVEDDRQQRAGLFLRDVSYRLHARFSLQDDSKHIHHYPDLINEGVGNDNSYPKFAEMFKRRARKGQCFNQPYLGTREFSADFCFVEPDQKINVLPIDVNLDLGWMLYDIDYSDPENPTPMFFYAKMEKGKIVVPDRESEEVRR